VSASLAPGWAEASEAEGVHDILTAVPAAMRMALGIAVTRIGEGVVAAVRDDPSGIWSRAVGFGFREPATSELAGQICDFFRSSGTPQAAIQLAPAAIPETGRTPAPGSGCLQAGSA
jgi:hypothetical protein